MKKLVILIFVGLLAPLTLAENSGKMPDKVVAPDGAEKCEMPKMPPEIPEGSGKSELIEAQGEVKQFQAGVKEYRSCLEAISDDDELTEENRLALDILHDKSVNLEEKVAKRFNNAVQEWKSNSQNQ